MIFVIYMPLAYLVGSIPFGLILTRLAGLGDIRAIGSGNIGATNVLRTGNKFLAALTLFLDGAKGAVFIAVFYFLAEGRFYPVYYRDWFIGFENGFALLIGLLVILGHCYPIWLKFKGGKGVATSLGVFLIAVPYAGLAAIAVWLTTAFVFRYSSLAALVAITVAAFASFLAYGIFAGALAALIAALVFFQHRENIKRLMAGTESKIGQKS